MSVRDSDSDGYQYDSLPDLHRDDSLPDLVLSSSPRTKDFLSSLDLTAVHRNMDIPTDIQTEYFTAGDQVSATYDKDGIMSVSYSDHSKVYPSKMATSDNYRSYLNLAIPSDDDSDDDSIQEKFKSMSVDDQTRQREDWMEQLTVTEIEIQEIQKRIGTRARQALILKRNIGLTAWREFSEDMKEGIRKMKESDMYQKIEETLNETLEDLTNFVISSDNFINKTVETIESEVVKVKELATEEILKAHKKTSEGFSNVQRRASESLEKIGVLEPPKEYRATDLVNSNESK